MMQDISLYNTNKNDYQKREGVGEEKTLHKKAMMYKEVKKLAAGYMLGQA